MHILGNLPSEIFPIILGHVVKEGDLAACCLVNRVFQLFAAPILYESVYIYAWHKNWKEKVR